MARIAKTLALGFFSSLLLASSAHARPTYFEAFRTKYAINDGDHLDACGVCHYKWTGTGARNPFGSSLEQQLYVGKSVDQSLTDIEGDDPDDDGYTNITEILAQTLPGFSCTNFQSVVDPPADWYTYITPGVPSCLEPLDIRVTPLTVSVLTEVGDTDTVTLTIFNNGTDFPVDVSSYGFLAGTAAAYTAVGPTPPFSIPVGSSTTIDLVFSPLAPAVAGGTFRIESNDPDQAQVDIALSGFAYVKNLAPAESRAGCRNSMDRQYRKYTKTVLREWGRCYQDETFGIACDTGVRDLKLAAAADRLRNAIGGAKDKDCAGQSLTPPLLDLPLQCGGACDAIANSTLSAFAECLICRADEARDSLLGAAMGTAPPDLPPNTLVDPVVRACQKRLVSASEKGVARVQKLLGPCEVANITAISPVECGIDFAAEVAAVGATVDATLDQCVDTTAMLGCLFDPTPDPACLGDAAEAIGADLVNQIFDTRD